MRRIAYFIFILTSLSVKAQQLQLIGNFNDVGLLLEKNAEFDNKLFFVIRTGISGEESLFSIDQNNLVNIVYTSTSSIFNLVQHGNHLYFTSNGSSGWAFYRVDSVGNVNLVSETNAPFLDAIEFNNEIFFSSVNDSNLYAYSETTNAFRLVDSNFDYGMSVSGLTLHNGELYFRGEIENSGGIRALYKTDGTFINPVVVFDPNLFQTFGNPYEFVSFGNELYFSAPVDADVNYRLFKVNTVTNTLSLIPDYYVDFEHLPYVFNNQLFFSARANIDRNTPHQLFAFDTSSSLSTIPLSSQDGTINLQGSAFGSITPTNDFYVVAFTNQVGYELFSINNGVLELFDDFVVGSTWGVSPNYSPFISYNNKLYLGGGAQQSGTGLSTQLFELEASNCQNTVDIEDPNFETYLENVLNVGDGVFGNKKVCKELVETITSISISSLNISDLTGIAAFRDLRFLEASSNQLSTVDLSANTNLLSINLDDNQLTSLDFSANTELFALSVNNNQITGLNLSNNGDLVEVRANGNSLQTLNINGLTTLENVQLSSNQLTGTLDFSAQTQLFQLRLDSNFISNLTLPASARMESLFVSNNPNLSALDVSVITANFFDIFQATNLPSLSCIQVRDINEANNETEWTKDASTEYSLDCSDQPFIVRPTISGAGSFPSFEIEEGDSFQLSFEALTNESEGQQFNVDLNTDGSTALLGPNQDFNFDIAEANFTVSAINNPDGIINFTSLIDNFSDDEDELIIVNLPRPATDYQWENANPDGSLSFTVLLRSRTEPIRIGISVFEETTQLSPNEYVLNGTQPAYLVEEGDKDIVLKFNALNLNEGQTLGYSVDVETPIGFGTAERFVDFNPIDRSANLNIVDNDFDNLNGGSMIIRIRDDLIREFTETLAVKIRPTTPLPGETILVDYNNGIEGIPVGAGEEFTLWIDIKDDDNTSEPFVLRATLSDEVSGNPDNYSINEGDNFQILIEALSPATESYNYRVNYDLSGEALLDDDFNFADGDIIDNGVLTVSSENPDGIAAFEIFENDGPDSGESMIIKFTRDNENVYVWEGANSEGELIFDITINEPSNQPFTVTPSITGSVTGTLPNFEIVEGQSFNLNFEASNAAEGTPYKPKITIRRNGAETSEDFNIDNIDNSFNANSNNPDGSIIFEAIDDDLDEGDEVYTILIESEDTEIYAIEEPISFEVVVKDRTEQYTGEPFLIAISLSNVKDASGDNSFADAFYEADEGTIFELSVNAIVPNEADGFTFFLLWSSFDSNLGGDARYIIRDENGNEISTNSNILEFTVDNDNDFDRKLSIEILDDGIFKSDEYLNFVFLPVRDPDDEFGEEEVLASILGAPSNESDYSIQVNINEKSVQNGTDIVFSNSGTTEGSGIPDVLTLTLVKDGQTETNNTGQPIIITPEFSINEGLAPFINLPATTTFTIAPEESSASIEINYGDGYIGEDREYEISFENDQLPSNYFLEPRVYTLKVIDNEDFIIDISFSGNVRKGESGGQECCFWYFVEEGEKITFEYEAEKGVPNEIPYQVDLNIGNDGFAPNTSNYIPFSENNSDYSFTEDVTMTLERSVKDGVDNLTQLTILDTDQDGESLEYFSINFSSTKRIRQIGSDDSGNFTFVIIEAPLAQLTTTDNTAAEASQEQPSTDKGIVTFKVDNDSVEDIELRFKLSGTADYPSDYTLNSTSTIRLIDEEMKIFSVLLDTNGEAVIEVIPVDEDQNEQEPEPTETVLFTLEDNFGYNVDDDFAQIDILDTDRANNFVQLADIPSEREQIFEDSSRGATSFFEILLMDENGSIINAANEFKVEFELKPENGQPVAGSDFKIYDGNETDRQDISSNSELFVTIKEGESAGIISVEALTDLDIEPSNELITIQLVTGPDYEIKEITKTASISIVSEQRGDDFDPSQISAKIFSPTCPGFNEGQILVENQTQFDFVAELYQNNTKLNEINLNQDTSETFSELQIGDFEIKIKSENPDIIPPTFRLTIRNDLNENNLISSTLNTIQKTASLVVSGSSFYRAEVNGEIYDFEFENRDVNTLVIPVENGVNNVEISGEAVCQGKLSTQLVLANYKVYPNPSENLILFSGLAPDSETKLMLFSTTGQLSLENNASSDDQGLIEIDVSRLPSGTYFGKVLSKGQELFQVKLLKK